MFALIISVVHSGKLFSYLRKTFLKTSRSDTAPKAAALKVDPFPTDCCPGAHKDLELIETRFEGQQCFAELQCRVCRTLWTAEIGPTPGNANPLTAGIGDRPGWRVLGLTRHTSR